MGETPTLYLRQANPVTKTRIVLKNKENMKIIILENSLEKFIKNLQKPTIAKVLRTIDLLEKFGPKLLRPHVKKVSTRLFELRISGKQEIRIFYIFRNSQIFLLHGFIKKSQKIPKKEIKTAMQKLEKINPVRKH